MLLFYFIEEKNKSSGCCGDRGPMGGAAVSGECNRKPPHTHIYCSFLFLVEWCGVCVVLERGIGIPRECPFSCVPVFCQGRGWGAFGFRGRDGGRCSHLGKRFHQLSHDPRQTAPNVSRWNGGLQSMPYLRFCQSDLQQHVTRQPSPAASWSVWTFGHDDVPVNARFSSVCRRRESVTSWLPVPCLTSTTSPTWVTSLGVSSALTSSPGTPEVKKKRMQPNIQVRILTPKTAHSQCCSTSCQILPFARLESAVRVRHRWVWHSHRKQSQRRRPHTSADLRQVPRRSLEHLRVVPDRLWLFWPNHHRKADRVSKHTFIVQWGVKVFKGPNL